VNFRELKKIKTVYGILTSSSEKGVIKTQWLVSFIGWPAKFNEWINAEDIKPAEEQT
jgi:hypothetical protein